MIAESHHCIKRKGEKKNEGRNSFTTFSQAINTLQKVNISLSKWTIKITLYKSKYQGFITGEFPLSNLLFSLFNHCIYITVDSMIDKLMLESRGLVLGSLCSILNRPQALVSDTYPGEFVTGWEFTWGFQDHVTAEHVSPHLNTNVSPCVAFYRILHFKQMRGVKIKCPFLHTWFEYLLKASQFFAHSLQLGGDHRHIERLDWHKNVPLTLVDGMIMYF